MFYLMMFSEKGIKNNKDYTNKYYFVFFVILHKLQTAEISVFLDAVNFLKLSQLSLNASFPRNVAVDDDIRFPSLPSVFVDQKTFILQVSSHCQTLLLCHSWMLGFGRFVDACCSNYYFR